MERETDSHIWEVRELTPEEMGLVRAYVWLDAAIQLLADHEDENVVHITNEATGVQLDWNPQARWTLIQSRKTIADLAFQQGFALHILIAMNSQDNGE